MEEQNTQQPTRETPDSERVDRPVQTETQAGPASPEPGTASAAREDDRNDELDQSPVPDPEAKDTGTEDDPQAD
jgi:hypothetical protein